MNKKLDWAERGILPIVQNESSNHLDAKRGSNVRCILQEDVSWILLDRPKKRIDAHSVVNIAERECATDDKKTVPEWIGIVES